MRNNDFEFIKDKFENAQLDVPRSLDADIMEKKIMAKTEHKKIKFRKKHKFVKNLTAVAACFIIIAGAVFAYNAGYFDTNRVTGFKNYDELNAKISTLDTMPASGEMGCGIFYTKLDRKDENSIYPDNVKTDGEYLYYAYQTFDSDDNYKVYIYKINNGKTEFVSVIGNLVEETYEEDSDSFDFSNIIVKDNRLIILMTKYNFSLSDKYKRDFNETLIKIYDITDRSKPYLLNQYSQSGEYFNSVIINNKLYVASNYNIVTADENYNVPNIKQNDDTYSVTAKNTFVFENTTKAQYAVLSTINIETGKQASELKAFLGGSPKIHIKDGYIYIHNCSPNELYGEPNENITSAMKLNVKNSRIYYAAKEEIDNYLYDTVDIGKSSYYQSTMFSVGDYYINIGYDNETFISDIILFDKEMNQLDSISLDSSIEVLVSNYDFLAMDNNKITFAVPAYFKSNDEPPYSSFGCVVFGIENGKIIIKDNLKSGKISNGYYGRSRSIISGDYIYCFDINDTAEDSERLDIVSFKYK